MIRLRSFGPLSPFRRADFGMIVTSRRRDQRDGPRLEIARNKKEADEASAAPQKTWLANKPKSHP